MKTMFALYGALVVALLLLPADGNAQAGKTGSLSVLVRTDRTIAQACSSTATSTYLVVRKKSNHKIVLEEDLCPQLNMLMKDSTDVCANQPTRCPQLFTFFGLPAGQYVVSYDRGDSSFQASNGARGSLKPLGYYVVTTDTVAPPKRISDPQQATILTVDPKKRPKPVTLWLK